MADFPLRVRLRPLEATAACYRDRSDRPAIEALTGTRLRRSWLPPWRLVLHCPVTGRRRALRRGLWVVRFTSPCRVVVTSDAAFGAMYERIRE